MPRPGSSASRRRGGIWQNQEFGLDSARGPLLSRKLGLEEKGSERNQGADEDQTCSFDGPSSLFHGEVKEDEEDREDPTVDPPGKAHTHLIAEEAIVNEGNVAEDDPRDAVEEREEAQEAERILEHRWALVGLLRSLLSEHELIAFGVVAEGEVDKAILLLGFADEVATILPDEIDPFPDVIALEAEAGPGPLAFSPAVNTDGGTTEGDFAPHLHLKRKLGRESRLIELDRAKVVGRPDGVFHFFNLHSTN